MKALFSETGDKESNLSLSHWDGTLSCCNWFLCFCNMYKNAEPVNEQFMGFWVFWWSEYLYCLIQFLGSSPSFASLLNISATLGRLALSHGNSEMKAPSKASWDFKLLTSVILKDPHLQLRGRNVAFRESHMFGGAAWEESRHQVGGRVGSKCLHWITFKYKNRAYVPYVRMVRMHSMYWCTVSSLRDSSGITEDSFKLVHKFNQQQNLEIN